MTPYLWIGLGGFLGACARHWVNQVARSIFGIGFPYGTLIINISGSFLLGIIATLITRRMVTYSDHLQLAIAVGFIGAYTTFSTYELESHDLMESGRWSPAFLYLVGSVVVGLVAVRLGILLARRWE